MTTAADDSAAEDAFEALLAGRPVPGEAAGLAAFAEAVRTTANSPGRPNAALAELLATGLLTDQSSPSARTARSAGVPPSRRSRVRNRRRFMLIFPALLAKLLSAGAVAQAATGAGVVVVVFTGAGAAGVLPNPVQSTFSSIVGSETSEEVATAGDETTEATPTEAPATEDPALGSEADVTETVETSEVTDPAEPTEAEDGDLTLVEWQRGPAADQSFGDWVSDGAECGFKDGQTISYWAHQKNVDWSGDATATPTPTTEDAGAGVEGERDWEGDGDGDRGGDDRGGDDRGGDDRGGDRGGRGNGNGGGRD
jgi:hypothetical protein